MIRPAYKLALFFLYAIRVGESNALLLIHPVNGTKRSYGTKTTSIYPSFYQRNVPMGQGY
jgi:hypothetical protein